MEIEQGPMFSHQDPDEKIQIQDGQYDSKPMNTGFATNRSTNS